MTQRIEVQQRKNGSLRASGQAKDPPLQQQAERGGWKPALRGARDTAGSRTSVRPQGSKTRPALQVLVMMCAVLCLATAALGQRGEGNVSGKVVAAQGGQPIRKAIVQLNENGGDQPETYTTATDAAGVFKFEGVTSGEYSVSVTRTGYFLANKKERLEPVTVEAGQNVTGLVYKMDAAGVISGKIVDGDGDPLAGIDVVVFRKGEQSQTASAEGGELGRAITDDLGEFRVGNLHAGVYAVRAEPAGQSPPPNPADKGHAKERAMYVNTYYPGSLDEKEAGAVLVRAGETSSANFGLMSSEAYRVSGTVVGLGSGMMSGILLTSRSGTALQQDLNENGGFEFPNVQPGTYEARVLLIATNASSGKPTAKFERVRAPIVVSGADVIGLELQPDPGGTVNGKLLVEGDEKVDWSLMQVSLQAAELGEDSGPAAVQQLDSAETANAKEDGSFEFKDVPGGNYGVKVDARSSLFRDYYIKSVIQDGRDVADAGFTVSGGAAVEVVLSGKGASIEGTVVDTKGFAVVDAYVLTVPSSGKHTRPDAYQQEQTDVHGQFELHGLNPGEFVVLALRNVPGDVRSAEFLGKYVDKGTKVSLEEGEKKSVQVTVVESQ